MRTLEQKAELVSEFLTQVKAQFPTVEIKRILGGYQILLDKKKLEINTPYLILSYKGRHSEKSFANYRRIDAILENLKNAQPA